MSVDLSTIVYVSSAASLMGQPELEELLAQSRERNVRDSITGLLLYCEGNFMQCLEGPSTPLNALYASILRDSRHRGLVELTHHNIKQREFADWSMAFSHANEAQIKLLNPGRKPNVTDAENGFSTTQLLVGFWQEQMGIARGSKRMDLH